MFTPLPPVALATQRHLLSNPRRVRALGADDKAVMAALIGRLVLAASQRMKHAKYRARCLWFNGNILSTFPRGGMALWRHPAEA
jgi:hypothetical protein